MRFKLIKGQCIAIFMLKAALNAEVIGCESMDGITCV